jgi:hypothetical protein
VRKSREELAEFYNTCVLVKQVNWDLPYLAGKGKVRESLEELAEFYNMCAKRKEKQRRQIPLKGAPFY